MKKIVGTLISLSLCVTTSMPAGRSIRGTKAVKNALSKAEKNYSNANVSISRDAAGNFVTSLNSIKLQWSWRLPMSPLDFGEQGLSADINVSADFDGSPLPSTFNISFNKSKISIMLPPESGKLILEGGKMRFRKDFLFDGGELIFNSVPFQIDKDGNATFKNPRDKNNPKLKTISVEAIKGLIKRLISEDVKNMPSDFLDTVSELSGSAITGIRGRLQGNVSVLAKPGAQWASLTLSLNGNLSGVVAHEFFSSNNNTVAAV